MCIFYPSEKWRRDQFWKFVERKKLDVCCFRRCFRSSFKDYTLVKMGRFCEFINRKIKTCKTIYFDSKARFFQNFSYDSIFRRFIGINPTTRKHPNRDISSFDKENPFSIRSENGSGNTCYIMHMLIE